MVRLTVLLSTPVRDAEGLLDALRYVSTATRFGEGWLGCSVWAGPESTVQYIEEWSSEEDMRRRVRSEAFTALLAVIESVPAAPQVRFDFVTRTRGLDYVAEVRESNRA